VGATLDPVQITRSGVETNRGSSESFTGSVYVDPVAVPVGPSRVSAGMVHFTPAARTAWHRHRFGQTIYVTEGVGLVQRRGGPAETVRAGDRIFFEPEEEHWHGAAPGRFMVHLALQQVDQRGSAGDWGEKVSDDEYATAAAMAVKA